MEIIIEGMRKHGIKYLHFVGICKDLKFFLSICKYRFLFIVFAASFLPGSWNMPQWMHPTVRESHKMYDYIKSVEDITWVATMAPNISDSAYTGNYKVKYVHYLECSKFLFIGYTVYRVFQKSHSV